MASTILTSFVLIIAGALVSQLMTVVSSEEMSFEGLNCNSCGRDCSAVCGTRQFRSCCFNYIRKRTDPTLLAEEGASAGSSSSAVDPSAILWKGGSTRENQLSPNTPSSVDASRRDFLQTLDPSSRHQFLLIAQFPHRLSREQQQQPQSSLVI